MESVSPIITEEALSLLQAEPLCAELLRKGVSFEQLHIHHNGNFRKSYRADAESLTSDENEHTLKLETHLRLNRDGIYDRLPEGLFHQPQGHSRVANAGQMKGEHRRYKEEEKAARKFFQPFEQEFFRYQLLTEQAEQALSINMMRGNINENWQQFWGLGGPLPKDAMQAMARLMPWAYLIKGRMVLTAMALQSILNKVVEATLEAGRLQSYAQPCFKLGSQLLGLDTVPGSRFDEAAPCWRFTIYGVPSSERILYPEGQPFGVLLKRFEEIFIPISTDTIFDVHPGDQEDVSEGEEVLGFGFIL